MSALGSDTKGGEKRDEGSMDRRLDLKGSSGPIGTGSKDGGSKNLKNMDPRAGPRPVEEETRADQRIERGEIRCILNKKKRGRRGLGKSVRKVTNSLLRGLSIPNSAS